jgi:D-glycero-D-manno-heptose 1,7-bisphosphate phosphatase
LKVAFLDRDGTIIEDYEDNLWSSITEPVFINGSIDALKAIMQKGYEIIIITNQYLINEKIITLQQYKEITDKFIKRLLDSGIEILDIFYCPHSKEENCNCMKPKDGMIKMALEKYPEIDLENSFIVGDSLCDVQLGERLGIKTFGIRLDKSKGKTIKIDSIKDIVKYL